MLELVSSVNILVDKSFDVDPYANIRSVLVLDVVVTVDVLRLFDVTFLLTYKLELKLTSLPTNKLAFKVKSLLVSIPRSPINALCGIVSAGYTARSSPHISTCPVELKLTSPATDNFPFNEISFVIIDA